MNAPAPSPIDELYRWHQANELDRPAPPWRVERAENHYRAFRAARTSSPFAGSMLEEVSGSMVRYADRCAVSDQVAARLEKAGLGQIAEKTARCSRHGRFVQRDSDARLIPIPDEKCRQPRCCPHCAREESARLHRRYQSRILDWIKEPQRNRNLPGRTSWFMTLSPPPVPNERLEWAMRDLFVIFDRLRRNRAGENIALALAALEITYPAPGRPHPHLHILVGAEGAVSFKAWRAELDRLLRETFAPIIAGDVLRRPSGEVVRVESVRYAPHAVHETARGGKRRFECDPSGDVALLSDGTRLSVAELRAGFASGGLAWAYRLRCPLTGKTWRVTGVRHAPGADRRGDAVTLESGNRNAPGTDGGAMRAERSLGGLLDEIARGEIAWDTAPLSFQQDFKRIEGGEFKVRKSLRELVKYMVKHNELMALADEDLRSVIEAGGRKFRRVRAYGRLHGAGKESDEAEVSALRPMGTYRYDGQRRDVELRIGGEVALARELYPRVLEKREAERRGRERLIGLIPDDRSAALKKAHKSADGAGALAGGGCYDGGFYDTGPPGGDTA